MKRKNAFNKSIMEAISYDRFNMTDHVLCQMTDLYFENDQPMATKP